MRIRLLACFLTLTLLISSIPMSALAVSAAGDAASNSQESGNLIPAESITNITGKHITMGVQNGQDIIWEVLAVVENRALLFCDYILDLVGCGTMESFTYENSELDDWCKSFYEGNTLTEDEKAVILNGIDGNRTIFFLSKTEAQKCLSTSTIEQRYLFPGVSGEIGAIGYGTVPISNNNCDIWLRSCYESKWVDLFYWKGNETGFANSANISLYRGVYGACPACWIDLSLTSLEGDGTFDSPYSLYYFPSETASIVSFSPENGSKSLLSDSPLIQIKFNRAPRNNNWPSGSSPDLDFSKEPLSVYRASDNKLVYQVKENAAHAGTAANGVSICQDNTVSFSVGSCLEENTDYYVTMGKGFILFADGIVSPEIKKGDWQFTTTTEPVAKAFSTEASVKVGTGVSSREPTLDNVKWEDNWFATDSTKYNHELARTSMVLSAAAYTSGENMKNVWADFNFDTIKTYYPPKATKDNNDFVAYSFAAKELTGNADGITLIAIAVRGTPGSAEWYSNFNIGKYEFLHTGFAQAAASLKENLESYLTMLKNAGYKIDNNTKYLITGHSRGAAVANIVAMNLTGNNYSDKTNIFAYTFATPAVTTRASQSEYNNIFNIINLEDFVPHVPMAVWGFGRYGIDIPLPSKSYYSSEYFDKIHTKMETQFIDMSGKSALHTYKEGTQEVNGLTAHVVELSPTKTDYYDTPNVFSFGISALDISCKTMHEYFTVLASFLAADSLADQVASVTSLVSSLNGDYAPITAFFIQHETFNQRVFDAHCPALYLSWMRSCTAEELFGYYNDESYPLYKQITIKCPVDVFVYNEAGTLVASVVNETVVKDTLAVSVNEGEKVVDLPSDQAYQVEIKARDTGTVDYIIEEKTANGSFDTTRTVFFDDIAIATGDILTGSIDTKENTTAANYSLTKNDETVIIATSDSNGNLFSVIVSNTENGTVSATPAWAAQGNEVTIIVTPDPGYELDTLTVTDKNGIEIQLTDQGNGRYTFTMPDSQVQVNASFVKGEAPTGLPFTDVKSGDWFYEDVAYVYKNSLMTGTSDTTFSPKGTTTRGMIVTILYRLENTPAANLSAFADVASNAYYAKAVGWASANGIVTGYSDVKFGPNDSITREQMAAILYRYAQYKGYDVSQKADLSKYQDQAAVSAYAKNAMAWANAKGLITGVTDTSLSPQGSAIRAQAAAILHRFCETVAK